MYTHFFYISEYVSVGFSFLVAQYESCKASVVLAVSVLISKVPNVPLRRSPSASAQQRGGEDARGPVSTSVLVPGPTRA